MIEAKVEPSANLLTIAYHGQVGPEETKSYLAKLEQMVQELQPGFRLLTDLSGLDTMELGCVSHIRSFMDLCNKKGVALIVRVIPDPHKDIGLNILSLFHYRRGIRIVTCETLLEAHKVLAG